MSAPDPEVWSDPKHRTVRLFRGGLLATGLAFAWLTAHVLTGSALGVLRLFGVLALLLTVGTLVSAWWDVELARRDRSRAQAEREHAARDARLGARPASQLRAVGDVQGQVDRMRDAERARRSGETEEGL